MGDGLDFDLLDKYLRTNNVAEAKRLVTRENVHQRDDDDGGVVWHLCNQGPDDPELLYHFVAMGASLEMSTDENVRSPQDPAAAYKKPKILRALLDLGVPPNVKAFGHTPFERALENNNFVCACVLLDAGATATIRFGTQIGRRLHGFITNRNKARDASIAILSLLKCRSHIITGNGKDVLRIVARCVWSQRGHTKTVG